MHIDKYYRTKKIAARIMAILLWIASFQFSLDGFGLQAHSANIMWVGWVMAAFITVMELVWNTPHARENVTILFIGILAYAYGIFTNITGFYSLQGGTLDSFNANPWSALMAVIIGLICEITPEALIVWSILDAGDSEEGDFIGNLFGWHKIEVPNNNKSGNQNRERYIPKPMKKSSNYPPSTNIPKPFIPPTRGRPPVKNLPPNDDSPFSRYE